MAERRETGFWEVDWDGETVSSLDLTIADLREFQKRTGVSYNRMDLGRDVNQLAWFLALYLRRQTAEPGELEAILEQRLDEVVDLRWIRANVRWVPDPKAPSETPTGT